MAESFGAMARQIAVIDAETDPFKEGRIPAPFLWGFYDGNTYEEFTDEYELIKFLYDKEIIVYAHNGGKFDYHFLLDYIDPFEEIMIINGRIAKFKIGACEFRDSYNILPTSLATYQKTEIDYGIFEEGEREKPHNWKKIRDYLYDDCRDLYEYVTAFIERYGMNLTQAGAAMKQWRKISEREPPHDFEGIIYKAFSKFYYGGRCQSFDYGIKTGDFKMIDINSAYPYAMLSCHPIGLDYFELDEFDIKNGEFDKLEPKYKSACFMTIECVSFGALPFRGKDNSLFFPADTKRRTYHITGWEYEAGIRTNTIADVEIKAVFAFYELTDFKDYILHFYEERKQAKAQGDKAQDIFCKLLMNSLYGKFGSNPDSYSHYMVAEPDVMDEDGRAGEWSFAGPFGQNILMEKPLDEEEARYYNVATSASITGYVRAFLWEAICGCEEVQYCDTDSILARDIKTVPNGFGGELGQWSVDGEFSEIALCGRKLYAFKYKEPIKDKKTDRLITHKVASKGTRLDAGQLYRIAQGEEVLYETIHPTFSVHRKPTFVNRTVKSVKKELREED